MLSLPAMEWYLSMMNAGMTGSGWSRPLGRSPATPVMVPFVPQSGQQHSGFMSSSCSHSHHRPQKRGLEPWFSNSDHASLSSMKIILADCSYGCPVALSGCTTSTARRYCFFTCSGVTRSAILTGVQRLSPSHNTVCRVDSSARMFLSLPSIQSKSFNLNGSVSLASSCFRISAMVFGPFLSDLEKP